MRVLVIGGAGMLGHKVFLRLSRGFDTFATFRSFDDSLRELDIFAPERALSGVDATDPDSVRQAIESVNPDVVINCVGIIKQLPQSKDPGKAIYTNALFPHLLDDMCRESGARLIQISTDCVFSGKRGLYSEEDAVDADDLYGRTKFLGELSGPNTLTLRTSIVGRELFGNTSLIEWFLSNRGGVVKGFTNAIYSGLTTHALSDEIARVIADFPHLTGLYHLSADPISKFDLLELLNSVFLTNTRVERVAEPACDRSLDSTRYRVATGFAPQRWEAMVQSLVDDPMPYDRWRIAGRTRAPR